MLQWKRKAHILPDISKNNARGKIIVTSDDILKQWVISHLAIVDEKSYEVFSLNNRMINVREATKKIVRKNFVIKQLVKILGLTFGVKYLNSDNLKFTEIVILTDASETATWQMGLLINFFHFNWPELIRLSLVHIVIATQKLNTFAITKESKTFFENLNSGSIMLIYAGVEDDDEIENAFTPDNKDWLEERTEIGTSLLRKKSYSEFVQELKPLIRTKLNAIQFPVIDDGFTPIQQKIISIYIAHGGKDTMQELIESVCTQFNIQSNAEAKNVLTQEIRCLNQKFVGRLPLSVITEGEHQNRITTTTRKRKMETHELGRNPANKKPRLEV